MFALTVRDHLMIAHSFKGEVFGPAQALHGATYLVDATFYRAELDADDLVVDIGLASEQLHACLAGYNHRNLDDVRELQGMNTTTERLAQVLFQRLSAAIADGHLGPSAKGLSALKITLSESHIAWASYKGSL